MYSSGNFLTLPGLETNNMGLETHNMGSGNLVNGRLDPERNIFKRGLTSNGAYDATQRHFDSLDNLSDTESEFRKYNLPQTLITLPARFKNPKISQGGSLMTNDNSFEDNIVDNNNKEGEKLKGNATNTSNNDHFSIHPSAQPGSRIVQEHNQNGKCNGENGSSEDCTKDISLALQWLKQQVLMLKQQDKALARQFLDLGAQIHQLRGNDFFRQPQHRPSKSSEYQLTGSKLSRSFASLNDDNFFWAPSVGSLRPLGRTINENQASFFEFRSRATSMVSVVPSCTSPPHEKTKSFFDDEFTECINSLDESTHL
ncbi:unnamed protein product [Owenia fusiformis]|uniref:Uncharacterized protein n=1 Tax=Owenia fusiformis TaxID=6347 RepID=A0A8J1U8I4_OWEFU|nr:unnamed protein product [Owenia fusiformis]